VLETAAIVTTEANELLQAIHPRMPVILPREHYGVWLDPQPKRDLLELLRPYPAELLRMDNVGTWVNNARHEGPRCLEQPGGSQATLF
jgi:putative SOS response-associated peptidase YedK